MKAYMKIFAAAILILSANTMLKAQNNQPNPVIGHWDLTVDKGNNEIVPSWLEVKLSGFKTLVGHFVSEAGSARPVSKVNVDGQKITFSIPPQWENGEKDLLFEGTVENDKLSGLITLPDGGQHTFAGQRAPALVREQPPVWNEPLRIFNGTNLDGWVAQKPVNQWIAEN